MATTVSLETWRELLARWLRVLRLSGFYVGLPPLATVSDMRKLWVGIQAPTELNNVQTAWGVLGEAMELLELLSRVDNAAGWTLLFEVAGQPAMANLYGAQLAGIFPRFVLRVEGYELLERTTATVNGLLSLFEGGKSASTKFVETKENMLERFRELNHGGWMLLSLDADLAFEFEDADEFDHVMVQLLHITCSHEDQLRFGGCAQQKSNRGRAGFMLDSVQMRLPEGIRSKQFLRIANEAEFVISDLTLPALRHGQQTNKVVRKFLRNRLPSRRSNLANYGVETLNIVLGNFDEPAVRAVCSSIAHSASLRSFS